MKIEPLTQEESIQTIGEITINMPRRELSYQNKKIRLRKKEFELFEFLLRNKGRVVNRLTILEYLWNHNGHVSTNTLEVHIARLRRKLHTYTSQKTIQTTYGLGYRLIIPFK